MATIEYQIVDLGDSKNPLIRDKTNSSDWNKGDPKSNCVSSAGEINNSRLISELSREGTTDCVHHERKLVSQTKGETLENHQNERTLDSMECAIQERKQK